MSKLLSALLLATIVASGQSKTFSPPRLSDGKPDFNGIWQVRGNVVSNIDTNIEQKGVIVDPADGRIPYRPEMLAQRAQKKQVDPIAQCRMPGVPRLLYLPFPFQIAQAANQPVMALLSQYAHVIRNYNLRNDNMPGEHLDGLENWLGDSRAHWDGDTLVVDVQNFNDQTLFDAAGNFHSGELHVVERYALTGPNTLAYQAVITDPMVLTRPFTMRLTFARHTEKNFQLMEHECYADKEGPTVTVGDKPDTEHKNDEHAK